MTTSGSSASTFSPGERLGLIAGGVALSLVGMWHVALAAATPGHTIGDVSETLQALVSHPLAPADATGPVNKMVLVVVLLAEVCVVGTAGWFLYRNRSTRGVAGLATGKEVSRVAREVHGPAGGIVAFDGRIPIVSKVADTGLMIAAPQSGKTTRRVIPSVIDAPGPCLTTSTKSDVLWHTHALRAKKGRILVFDPEGVSHWPTKVTWDMVAGCEDAGEAAERANAMVNTLSMEGTRNGDFFAKSAGTVLRCLLHAAAIEGRTMREVVRWATDWRDGEPLRILGTSPRAQGNWRNELEVLTRGDARETASSTQMALSIILSPLTTGNALESVLPTDHQVDIDEFIHSTDTLYLMSQSGQGSAAPVTTALTAAVDRRARLASQHTKNRRLDPPLTMILDEVANIAALPSLPALMTDGGARGMSVWAITQSKSQLEARWGQQRAQTIINGSAMKLILGGGFEDDFLEQLSDLVGEHQVERSTHSDGGKGQGSTSVSMQWERILRPEQIRELRTRKALLFYRNARPAIVDLPGWWERKDRKAIEASVVEAQRLEGIES